MKTNKSLGHSRLKLRSDAYNPTLVCTQHQQLSSLLPINPLSHAPAFFPAAIPVIRFWLDHCPALTPILRPCLGASLGSGASVAGGSVHMQDLVPLGLCEDPALLPPEVWREASVRR